MDHLRAAAEAWSFACHRTFEGMRCARFYVAGGTDRFDPHANHGDPKNDPSFGIVIDAHADDQALTAELAVSVHQVTWGRRSTVL